MRSPHILVLLWVFCLFVACSSSNKLPKPPMGDDIVVSSPTAEVPYYISVKEVLPDSARPSLESFASGRSGEDLLFIGGRIGGFHGTANTAEGFHKRETNRNIVVLNIKTGNTWMAPVPADHEQQFTATNTQHAQHGDTLWVTGGYAIGSGEVSNTTSDRITAVSISKMIAAVKANDESAIEQAVLYSIQDDFVRVTGGEMLFIEGIFYLVMGQNYTGEYTPGLTGKYTEEVRIFRLTNENGNWEITDRNTISYPDDTLSQFHRRDLNVAPVVSNNKRGFTVYGGVFNGEGDGWLNPIHFKPDGSGGAEFRLDATQQLCNNYSCAFIPLYNPSDKSMYVSFLGGIGHMQWVEEQLGMVPGDGSVKLPWVNTISTLGHTSDQKTVQHMQIPGKEPTLPTYLGAEAVFIPDESLLFADDILNLEKCAGGESRVIGHMYGGIRATAPTSSSSFPTVGSNAIYEVTIHFNN